MTWVNLVGGVTLTRRETYGWRRYLSPTKCLLIHKRESLLPSSIYGNLYVFTRGFAPLSVLFDGRLKSSKLSFMLSIPSNLFATYKRLVSPFRSEVQSRREGVSDVSTLCLRVLLSRDEWTWGGVDRGYCACGKNIIFTFLIETVVGRENLRSVIGLKKYVGIT